VRPVTSCSTEALGTNQPSVASPSAETTTRESSQITPMAPPSTGSRLARTGWLPASTTVSQRCSAPGAGGRSSMRHTFFLPNRSTALARTPRGKSGTSGP